MTKHRSTPPHGKKHAASDKETSAAAQASAASLEFLAFQRAQDGEHVASQIVDFLLHAVDATIDETRKANNTFEYTSLKLVNGLIYMMSMVTIDLSTKVKDNPATYDAGEPPAPCAPDIWSKHFIRAKKKRKPPVARGISHTSPFGLGAVTEEGGSEHYRSSYQRSPSNKPNVGGRRSPERSSQPAANIVVEAEFTMTIRDLAFRTVSLSDAPLSADDLERRELIEKMLEERERDEKLRMQADAKRSQSAVRLVIDPVDTDAKPARKGFGEGAPPSPEAPLPLDDPLADGLGNERGASEVILVDGAEMIVGADSHLVSRRSKRDMFKHIPNAVFEPTVILPPTTARVVDIAATAVTARPTNNSRSSSRRSSRARTPKTPGGSKTARTRAYFAALLATDEPFFVGNSDRDGGPCFGDDTSPAKGVVITHGLVVKSGEQWEGRQPTTSQSRGIPKTASEPVFEPLDQVPSPAQLHRRPSLQRLPATPNSVRPEDSAVDDAAMMPPTQSPPQVLTLDRHIDHHRHATSKSMSLRIRTPACRKRRSRKLVDEIVVDHDQHMHQQQRDPMPSMAEHDQEENNQPPESPSTTRPSAAQRRPSTNSTTAVTPQKLVRSPAKQIRLPRVDARLGTPLGGGGRVVYHAASTLTLPLLKQQSTLS